MARNDPKTLPDGTGNFLGGMDSRRNPALLADNQVAFAVNITFRGGYADQRPPFLQRVLSFADTEARDWFEQQLFQGLGQYRDRLVAVVGGRVFLISPRDNYVVAEITPRVQVAANGELVGTSTTSLVVDATPKTFTTQAGLDFVVGETIRAFNASASLTGTVTSYAGTTLVLGVTSAEGSGTLASWSLYRGAITPPLNSSFSLDVASASAFQTGLPVYVLGGTYVTTSKTDLSVTLTNINGQPGVAVPSGTVIEASDPNLRYARQNWMVQAEQYLIVQDGSSRPIIYSGSSRRADITNQEVPTGKAMAFGNGRLWVAINGRQFVAGDINYGPTRVIDFTENTYIAEGGAFSVPSDAGDITAMLFMPVLNAALGQGPLQIFTENSVYSVNLPVTREDWKNLTDPVQTMGFRGFGAVSDGAVVIVNGDVFYRARDGIRSYMMAVREFNTWGNVPISSELARVITTDPVGSLDLCSAAIFDNRLLFTTALQPDGYGAYGNALGVMDFEPISAMGQKSPPVWDGFWTGLDIRRLHAGIFHGMERCYAITRNTDGKNNLYEIAKTGQFDSEQCRITSIFESRSHAFGSVYSLGRLDGAEFWVDNLAGDVDWTLRYRQDQSPCWKAWHTWSNCQSSKDCPVGNCWEPQVHLPGFRTRMSIPQPVQLNDDSDGKPSRIGYEFQIRLEWQGRARLRQYLLRIHEEQESPGGNFV